MHASSNRRSDPITLRYLGREGALFVGPLPAPVRHRHHTLQGFVALDGAIDARIGSRVHTGLQAGLIAPDVEHALEAEGEIAHFYTMPESAAGARIRARLGRSDGLVFGARTADVMRTALAPLFEDEANAPRCLTRLLELAAVEPAEGEAPRARRDARIPILDPRVASVLQHLRRTKAEASLASVADTVGLGPDRLRHLLRTELGLTFRELRRWLRLLRALDAMRDGASITEAALRSGFADTAHLSRTFRAAFTFPPSAFVAESRFVQAEAPGAD